MKLRGYMKEFCLNFFIAFFVMLSGIITVVYLFTNIIVQKTSFYHKTFKIEDLSIGDDKTIIELVVPSSRNIITENCYHIAVFCFLILVFLISTNIHEIHSDNFSSSKKAKIEPEIKNEELLEKLV